MSHTVDPDSEMAHEFGARADSDLSVVSWGASAHVMTRLPSSANSNAPHATSQRYPSGSEKYPE